MDTAVPADRLVSIITPAYNAERFIGEAIASVQKQTYPHWEMLVIDDGSRDATGRIVAALARDDTRIRFIQLPSNGGPAAARNAGLRAARGEYIAFLDSDDLWLPEKLERQLAFMRARDIAICFTQYRRISQTGEVCGRLIPVPSQLGYRQLLKNTAIATSTVMVDRQRTGPFEMVDTYYDDYALWLSLTRRGFVAHALREDLVRYRVVGHSVSRRKVRSARWVWRTYRRVEHLPWWDAAWCFAHYAVRACLKYRAF